MRALRDINITEILTDDLPIIMDLINDLDVPRKQDPDFLKVVSDAVQFLGLKPEHSVIVKVKCFLLIVFNRCLLLFVRV